MVSLVSFDTTAGSGPNAGAQTHDIIALQFETALQVALEEARPETRSRSEIHGNALAFPVAIPCRIKTITTAKLGRRLMLVTFATTQLGFRQCPLGSGHLFWVVTLIRHSHYPCRNY